MAKVKYVRTCNLINVHDPCIMRMYIGSNIRVTVQQGLIGWNEPFIALELLTQTCCLQVLSVGYSL